MSATTSFKQALRAWEKHYVKPESLWQHLSDEDLDLANLKDQGQRDRIVDHLCICRFCAERYRTQQESTITYPDLGMWDIAALKAAAGEQQTYPVTVVSEKGLYKIEIMRNSAGGEDGLAVLSILDPNLAVQNEGTIVWICDAGRRVLLRGAIVKGEIWQKIPRLDEYDYSELLVYVTDHQETTTFE